MRYIVSVPSQVFEIYAKNQELAERDALKIVDICVFEVDEFYDEDKQKKRKVRKKKS